MFSVCVSVCVCGWWSKITIWACVCVCVGVYVSDSVYEFVQKDHYNRACWGWGCQKQHIHERGDEWPFQPPLS